jgi:hypothetical protein
MSYGVDFSRAGRWYVLSCVVLELKDEVPPMLAGHPDTWEEGEAGELVMDIVAIDGLQEGESVPAFISSLGKYELASIESKVYTEAIGRRDGWLTGGYSV